MSQIEENYSMDIEEDITDTASVQEQVQEPALRFVYITPLREVRLPFLEPNLVPEPVLAIRNTGRRIYIPPSQNRFLEPNLVPAQQIPVLIPENNMYNLVDNINEIPRELRRDQQLNTNVDIQLINNNHIWRM